MLHVHLVEVAEGGTGDGDSDSEGDGDSDSEGCQDSDSDSEGGIGDGDANSCASSVDDSRVDGNYTRNLMIRDISQQCATDHNNIITGLGLI